MTKKRKRNWPNDGPGTCRAKGKLITNIDSVVDCNERVMECPVCKDVLGKSNLSHPELHIDTTNITKTHAGAFVVFKHAHYMPNQAQGRNTWCTRDYIMIPRKYVKISYRIDDDEPLDNWLNSNGF